jgi:Holliday junction DNA helicase RuvA
MISYLKWQIIELEFDRLTILTSSWVWYEVFINELIYAKLVLQENAEIFIYHHRTENSQSLFWFTQKDEKIIFNKLIKISWVGWKVAMLILWLWVNRLLESIAYEDNKTIESIKWIGKKMAEKIILELKDKDFWIELWNNIKSSDNKNILSKDLFTSIKDTLVNMWYTWKNIDIVLKNLPEWMKEAGDIIPYIIKKLS